MSLLWTVLFLSGALGPAFSMVMPGLCPTQLKAIEDFDHERVSTQIVSFRAFLSRRISSYRPNESRGIALHQFPTTPMVTSLCIIHFWGVLNRCGIRTSVSAENRVFRSRMGSVFGKPEFRNIQ